MNGTTRRTKRSVPGSITTTLAALLVLGSPATLAWARPPAGAEPARALLRVEARGGGATPRTLYVGQTVPIAIRAYFLDGTGVSLNGPPHLLSDALMLSDLADKPVQTTTQLHGLPYTVVTWAGNVTAARAGAARTDVELPVELSYREPPRPPLGSNVRGDDDDSDPDDPFASMLKNTPFASDPFFSRMFRGGDPFAGMMRDLAGTVRQRAVTLRAPGAATQVLDLPAPQPRGFTGAVGHFDVAASASPGPYHAGEPITLRLAVTGEGSFARLSLAGVPPAAELSSYAPTAGTPSEHEKVFTQTLVPRRAGEITVPAVALTYFDPRARRYVTRTSQPLRLDVLPGAPEAPLAAPTTSAGTGEAALAGAAPAATMAALPEAVHATLVPLVMTRRFRLIVLASLLAAGALALAGRLVRTGALARRRARWRLRRELDVQQHALRDAARRGDAAALFAGGRRALQARLAAAWGIPADAIAAADVARRLGDQGAAIREIFEQADRHAYAGARSPGDLDLQRWPERISAELRALEART